MFEAEVASACATLTAEEKYYIYIYMEDGIIKLKV
jgi:hypothetical protein